MFGTIAITKEDLLDIKIGQMIMAGFHNELDVMKDIQNYGIGGIVLFERNLNLIKLQNIWDQ